MAFKIALTAGHYMNTPGKRCMKKLDPQETREWWLNDRIADKVEKLLKNYTGYQLIRTDDTTGKKDISLTARTNAANNFKADFYLSIHHNAGANGGTAGGIVAIVYSKGASAESIAWQKDLYNALIAATGLKGNRATPLAKNNLHEVRETKMPAVLLELGFMDSATDVPIILTEKFADQCAEAIVKVLVKRGGLKQKAVETKPDDPVKTDVLYRVQVGAYRDSNNALATKKKLEEAGFSAIIVEAKP
jgi:N-acetylmuramoyl-L-alanine amidase